MSTKIFISYRIDDSQSEASLIYGMLQEAFGKDTVFMDRSTIKSGDRWAEKIESDLLQAEIVLVVIKDARKWIGMGEWGDTRIKEEEDWVRQELERALQEGKQLIPLLIKGATFPPIKTLPETLHPLPGFQAMELSLDDSWEVEQRKIVDACKGKLEHTTEPIRQASDPVALVNRYGLFGLLAAALHFAESNKSFRAHIGEHQVDLFKFANNVRVVRETKELHDIAHHVQVDGLGTFKRKLMGSLSSDLEWEFPDEHVLIQEALKMLRAMQSENEAIKEKETWFDDFNLRLMALDSAIRNDDLALFKQEVNALDSLLKKQQMALNRRLICLVDNDLHLREVADELIEALRLFDDASEPAQTSKINMASADLFSFTDEFLWLRDVHDIWQDIDKELSLLEIHLSSPTSVKEALAILSDIERQLEKAFKKGEPIELSSFVSRMRDNQSKLRDRLFRAGSTETNPRDLQRALIMFSDPARKIFRAIDSSLKKRCKDLVKLGQLINELLIADNDNEDRNCA